MENKAFSDQQRSSSEISTAIEGLSMVVKAENGDSKDDQDDNSLQIPTKHFLSLCNSLVLHVLGYFLSLLFLFLFLFFNLYFDT